MKPKIIKSTVAKVTKTTGHSNELRSLKLALGVFNTELTLNQLFAFIEVALRPGTPVLELGERLGFGNSTSTRIASLLSDIGRGGREGLGLIEFRPSKKDRRIKELHLTKKGILVVKNIAAALP